MVEVPPIELVAVADIKVDGKNPNKMALQKFDALKKNIQRYGFLIPVVTNKDLVIADGQHRWEAAKDLKLEKVPVIRLDVSEVDRRILRQVLNKLRGEHVQDLDDEEFRFLLDENALDTARELLAQSDAEYTRIMDRITERPAESEFDVDAAYAQIGEAQTRVGDVWVLGKHKLVCGDSTDASVLQKLMGNEQARIMFTDPPYNVDYDQDESPTGRPEGSKGKILGDHQSQEDFEAFMHGFFQASLPFVAGAVYVCMGNSSYPELRRAFDKAGGHWSSTIVWNKDSFVLGRQDYHRKHELILYGWKKGSSHHWNGSRTESDVWDVPRPKKNDLHPTMKPVGLVLKALEHSTLLEDVVLDCFGGSGTTLVACEQAGRQARLIELDPKYCDVVVKRWEALSGQKAQRLSTSG